MTGWSTLLGIGVLSLGLVFVTNFLSARATKIATLVLCGLIVWVVLAALCAPIWISVPAMAASILFLASAMVGSMAEDRQFYEDLRDE